MLHLNLIKHEENWWNTDNIDETLRKFMKHRENLWNTDNIDETQRKFMKHW